MAMDKEMLLQRMQTQYLTRQEVLYKLPLNISINTFWPELIDRRKMKSVLLPLHRGDSKPYWYVLTDKMIAASEKLCSMALDCGDKIDPYRPVLTSAMTEEMFFTSFVEGAQVDLQEAMQFLERGTEPENVQEQLIQNNRTAWSDMLKMLFYPIDERFVRSLAYTLTNDMEGQATDYRQTDTHVIAAMGSEGYDVPVSSSLPGLMQEYYSFLASSDVHPLIKAVVGQAYLLVTRPFPDGNERLSRMISYAVLLRSGYDFFRDISISSVIARESYRYYKSMQDIIRSENDGDLTYFIEYYLDLLARAVDVQAEIVSDKQQESVEQERQMAKKPLSVPDKGDLQTSTHGSLMDGEIGRMNDITDSEKDATCDAMEHETEVIYIEGEDSSQGQINYEPEPTESPPRKFYTELEYMDLLNQIETNDMRRLAIDRKKRIGTQIRCLLQMRSYGFTRLEWERMTGVSTFMAKGDCQAMVKLGLLYQESQKYASEKRHYYLPLRYELTTMSADKKSEGDAAKEAIQDSILPNKQRDVLLQLMTAFPDEQFTIRDVAETMGIKYGAAGYYLDNLKQRGILLVQRMPGNVNRYSFSSKVHGIFESRETTGEDTVFCEMPATEKKAYDPLRGMADAG